MKLIILTVICIGLVHVKADCEDRDGDKPEGCYDEERIARIECETDTCVCKTPEEEDCVEKGIILQADLDGLTPDIMDGLKCKKLCEASKSSASSELIKCEYFRWEDANYEITEHCSFMNSVQCTDFEPCTGKHCQSGRADCPGGTVPEPNGESCAADAEWVDNQVHWKCINTFDDTHDRIDIYGSEDIPAGTMCFTDHKCIDFDDAPDDEVSPDYLYRTYVVVCNGADGKWIPYDQSNNDPTQAGSDNTDLLNGGAKLTDPVCNWNPAGPLLLDTAVLTESGVSLVCSNGDNLAYGVDDVTVTAPNTCALLCNFHHVMTIEPKYEETDGTTKWWRYPTGDDVGVEAKREDVFCWNQPSY